MLKLFIGVVKNSYFLKIPRKTFMKECNFAKVSLKISQNFK